MGMAGTYQCEANLELMFTTCNSLGFPIKYQKIEGPSPIISFLGIKLNTHKMEARLPQDKLEQVLSERDSPVFNQMTVTCLQGGRTGWIFLWRIIGRAKAVRWLNHWVHLMADFHSDLAWWISFLEYWNGCSMMRIHCNNQSPKIVVATDASGVWGCKAIWGN